MRPSTALAASTSLVEESSSEPAVVAAQRGTTPTAPGGEKKKRVLLLMSDTGGGHRASAEALAKAMEKLYPNRVACDIVDIWTDHAVWPYRNFVSYYQYVAKRPILWRVLWAYAKFPPSRRLQEVFANLQCHGRFRRCIASHDPDLVVSVHPLCQQIPIKVLKRLGEQGARKTPFVTVVTDLGGAHPTWFHKEADKVFIPSDQVRRVAKRAGIRDEKLAQHGLPLREGFWAAEPRGKAQLRETLGLECRTQRTTTTGENNKDDDALPEPMALVVGGGDGVGGIARVATAIGDELGRDPESHATLAVICGKNAAVRRQLEDRAWPKNVQVKVEGFVGNMHEWMAAADVLVTKAGPGTIAEASTRGLPCLISSYLPGQEAGNVKYVVENKFGTFMRRPKRIAGTIRSWFNDRNHLSAMQRDALAAARPAATRDIAKDIGDILFEASSF